MVSIFGCLTLDKIYQILARQSSRHRHGHFYLSLTTLTSINNLHADESKSVQSCSDSSSDSNTDMSDTTDAHLNNINITFDNNSSLSATICSLGLATVLSRTVLEAVGR
ncbi:hypothetical protein O9G_004633 [Rozella allomycis CSF55]|uniref:Uncharacterized protein n=1 Tax=Rozella allomycis (strain CSF55) TaxID=988480 RepID=A0A075AXX0_ROZAC|nr:hypothetical protein O9G_004633 [Rozella allomycis CSF55]|eukprot:EPZ33419.1 hypothetical protein O9G_004633 [Rozella allomycis CSF55]